MVATDALETSVRVDADVVGRAGGVADVTLVDVDVAVSSGVAGVGAVALVARDQVSAVTVNARTRLALVDVITAGRTNEAGAARTSKRCVFAGDVDRASGAVLTRCFVVAHIGLRA